MLLDTVARLLTCKTTLPMVAYSSRPAHPAPRPRAGGAAPRPCGVGGGRDFVAGAQRAAPFGTAPPACFTCARPAFGNKKPHTRFWVYGYAASISDNAPKSQ